MSYTPPAADACHFAGTSGYTPPAADACDFAGGELSTGCTALARGSGALGAGMALCPTAIRADALGGDSGGAIRAQVTVLPVLAPPLPHTIIHYRCELSGPAP